MRNLIRLTLAAAGALALFAVAAVQAFADSAGPGVP